MTAFIIGGVISWFASENPDGLEWSISKVTRKAETIKNVGGLIGDTNKSVAGVLGSVMVLGVGLAISFGIGAVRKRH